MITITRTHTTTKTKFKLSASLTPEDIYNIECGIKNYDFLIERNSTVTGKKFAELVNQYSDHQITREIAGAFIKADK